MSGMLRCKKIRKDPPETGAELALKSKLCVVGESRAESLHGCSEVYSLTRLLGHETFNMDSKRTFKCKGKYSCADLLQYF